MSKRRCDQCIYSSNPGKEYISFGVPTRNVDCNFVPKIPPYMKLFLEREDFYYPRSQQNRINIAEAEDCECFEGKDEATR